MAKGFQHDLVAHPKGRAYSYVVYRSIAEDLVGRSFRACDQTITGVRTDSPERKR